MSGFSDTRGVHKRRHATIWSFVVNQITEVVCANVAAAPDTARANESSCFTSPLNREQNKNSIRPNAFGFRLRPDKQKNTSFLHFNVPISLCGGDQAPEQLR